MNSSDLMTMNPTRPISMMPANTPGESAKRELLSMAEPSPSPPITISVTSTTIMQIGIAICSPVSI